MGSKLTFHIMGFDGAVFDRLQQMQPSTVKIFDFPSDANVDEIRRRCPDTLIVYRQYTDLTFKDSADSYFAELSDTLNKLRGRGVIWEGINEPVLGSIQDADTLSNWYVRFAELMHARQEKVAAFSFSTGNPSLGLIARLAPGAAACDYLALHEYYSPTRGADDLARYRAFRAQLPASAQKPILITECGVDDGQNNGWQKYVTQSQYLAILDDYDKMLIADDYVLGATIYQYGAGHPWQSFDVSSIGHVIAQYVASVGTGMPVSLERAAIAAAQKLVWMPINTDAALYRFAQMRNLGYPQTDEFEFTHENDAYIGQVYNLGIVYVKKGDWGNVKWTAKPS
ncbi:MAG: hypothetical protein HY782_07415 [Chloroflexi bacterium]|nr:hypothetical protein [Chloroflexota bacterium]